MAGFRLSTNLMIKSQKIIADPESFVHRVRKVYDVVDKDAIQKRLDLDKKQMENTEDLVPWGNPPGIYWMRRDAEERAKDMKEKERRGEKK